MLIGLYGGMANNCYAFARALAQAGMEICFIRDRGDSYAFSQPVWDDCRFTLSYAETAATANKSWSAWTSCERRLGWTAPAWLVDPLPWAAARLPPSLHRGLRLISRSARVPVRERVLALMRRCDALLVCGVDATLLAAQSGRPFGIWPHGGDIRMAAGLLPDLPVQLVAQERERAGRLREAYAASQFVGSHDPSGVGGDIVDVSSLLASVRFEHVPIPVVTAQRAGAEERRGRLRGLAKELGFPLAEGVQVGFVPSRIDFQWKGHEILLKGLRRLGRKPGVQLVFSGWGRDYDAARRMTKEADLEHAVAFLPCALSRPVLNEMFAAADFVVDQFRLGTYGTAMVEAMAAGAPVLMRIDTAAFDARGWAPPPVANCSSAADIADALRRFADEPQAMETLAGASSRWVEEVHGAGRVVRHLASLFAATPSRAAAGTAP